MIRISFKILEASKNFRKVNAGYLGVIQKNVVYQAGFLNHAGVRFNSSFATQDVPSLSQELVQASSFATQDVPSLSQELIQASLVAEPALSSLGLAGTSPRGLLQSGLEMLHVSLDIPWWSAIVLGTICIRIAIFPLVIMAQKNAANMTNNMPTINGLQQKMTTARMSGDPKGVTSAADELSRFMKDKKINPLMNFLPILPQAVIFFSTFTGIREMVYLPVESMKTGGIYWFTDLTIPDPLFLLPLFTAATIYATVEVGVDGIKINHIGNDTLKKIMRIMPIISFPVMINFPSAMLCYWLTSNAFSLVQVSFLKIPRVRKYFEIPEVIDHSYAYPLKKHEGPKLSFMESLRLGIKNLEIAREMEERRRLESLKLKEPSKVANGRTDDKP